MVYHWVLEFGPGLGDGKKLQLTFMVSTFSTNSPEIFSSAAHGG